MRYGSLFIAASCVVLAMSGTASASGQEPELVARDLQIFFGGLER